MNECNLVIWVAPRIINLLQLAPEYWDFSDQIIFKMETTVLVKCKAYICNKLSVMYTDFLQIFIVTL